MESVFKGTSICVLKYAVFCDGVTVFKGTSVCVLKSCSFLWWSDSVYRYIGMCFENVWIFVISSQFLKVHRSVF